MHFPTKKNAEQSPKRIKNENWINMLKVPIGTSRVPINIWEVPIRTSTLSVGTSTMPIGTILRIFLLRFFLS